jgi:hypothetical protein
MSHGTRTDFTSRLLVFIEWLLSGIANKILSVAAA